MGGGATWIPLLVPTQRAKSGAECTAWADGVVVGDWVGVEEALPEAVGLSVGVPPSGHNGKQKNNGAGRSRSPGSYY